MLRCGVQSLELDAIHSHVLIKRIAPGTAVRPGTRVHGLWNDSPLAHPSPKSISSPGNFIPLSHFFFFYFFFFLSTFPRFSFISRISQFFTFTFIYVYVYSYKICSIGSPFYSKNLFFYSPFTFIKFSARRIKERKKKKKLILYTYLFKYFFFLIFLFLCIIMKNLDHYQWLIKFLHSLTRLFFIYLFYFIYFFFSRYLILRLRYTVRFITASYVCEKVILSFDE